MIEFCLVWIMSKLKNIFEVLNFRLVLLSLNTQVSSTYHLCGEAPKIYTLLSDFYLEENSSQAQKIST